MYSIIYCLQYFREVFKAEADFASDPCKMTRNAKLAEYAYSDFSPDNYFHHSIKRELKILNKVS